MSGLFDLARHMRCLLSFLFGVRWVILTDRDSDEVVRKARHYKGGPYAVGLRGVRGSPIWLLNDGRAKGLSYVVKWEPYDPCDYTQGH